MNEPENSASPKNPQTLALIELSPLSPVSWEKLIARIKGQNDPLSIKTIEIIIDGLKAIEQQRLAADAANIPPPRISLLSQSMFVRLAKAYNSPTLLKEVGLIYLRDLNLPETALQHFERSMRLGGPEKELRPLIEAAAVAVQKQLARQSGQEQGHSGITTAQHAQPIAPTVIRKTGKLLLPTRMTQTANTKLAETDESIELETRQPMPPTTEECLTQAREAIANRKFRRAEMLLENADVTPADKLVMWQAWTDLGQACYELGLYSQVQTAFLKALKYGPKDLASHFNVGLGLHLNDRYEEALASYLKANQIEPKHPKVWCNLGVLYFQMEQYNLAESALRYATVANRDYARAWDNLAAALGAQDKLDDALEACQRALELRPDYPEAHFKLGVIHFSRSDFSQATKDFQRAALLPALAAYCDCLQAMIHARLEQTDAAQAAVMRAAQTDPKCELLWMAWNDLGLAFYAAGDFPASATAYGEATMIKPDEAEAWFNLGVSYHKTGDLKAARNSYQQAVDLLESMSGAWHNLGIVCAQTGDNPAAMNAFRQEVNWTPENVRAWYDLGVTLEKMGRRDEAKVAFAKVDSLSPKKLARTDRVSSIPAPSALVHEAEASAETEATQKLAELS